MPSRSATNLVFRKLTVGPRWNGAIGNWDPNKGPISKIVIHTMVGSVAGTTARFNDPFSSVSANYGIGLDGTIYQWVPENQVAYGNGLYSSNQTSISIEHEDGGNFNGPRPDILYHSSALLIADICRFYGIPCDRAHIIKHSEVPYPTTCPDGLDIDRLVQMAFLILNPPPAPTPSQAPQFAPDNAIDPVTLRKATAYQQVCTYLGIDSTLPDTGQRVIDRIKSFQVQITPPAQNLPIPDVRTQAGIFQILADFFRVKSKDPNAI